METEVDKLAKVIWDYMLMHQEPAPSDCILVLGSKDLAPAERACDLFLQGYAPIIIFSGYGKAFYPKSEAEVYRNIALKRGIPIEKIFIEDKSRNTGENILFSKELILKSNIPYRKIILVQKPYMERRVYATFKKQWPEPEIIMTSPKISYEDYVKDNPYYTKEKIINTMVGDLQRIKEYSKLGFQIEQKIPERVWQAYEKLVAMGYNKRLIS
ncbi:hypothetical protein A2911_02345 [Candidatus Nomurabacteria bacterium RIFCSPLOWO2_01_FULL_40_15]|uniref:DUF218 domain-containing protein n=1 Tax=Candidatus Nomurabacteria bacterium RIFCSPLOWO2_01_FULL_40_15 TaxID=1801772 RepID=A0A1F6X7W4_9BACT|nr:MAG: hypothetical protein A2911_02345 [Candidatus Nomurabacteria bacterium RIFCSPLOWO2_01_FULL_40_15]